MTHAAAATITSPEIALAPVQPGRRIVAVDILRGLAVLGILLVNMGGFAGFGESLEQMNPLDRAVTLGIRFVAQGKFYPLFSFLFGWGLAIQLERATRRGASFLPIYLRRLLVLLGIGLVHAVLIWSGDILVAYALLGFPLLLFRQRSERTLLIAATISLLLPVLISAPRIGPAFDQAYQELISPLREGLGGREALLAAGTYNEVTIARWRELRVTLASSLYWAPHVFGMFLLGLYAGRRGILHDVDAHLGLLRRVLVAGLVVGLPLNLLWIWAGISTSLVRGELYGLATRGARTVGGSALCLALVAAMMLLLRQKTWQEMLAGLAPVGRLALTNYLSHSVLLTLFFYDYGLGVYGELGPTLTLLLTLAIFRTQVFISEWWLARHRFGPMEWLWRYLTYGRRVKETSAV